MSEALAAWVNDQRNSGVIFFFDRSSNSFKGVRYLQQKRAKSSQFFADYVSKMGDGAHLKKDQDKFTIFAGKPRVLAKGHTRTWQNVYGAISADFLVFSDTDFVHEIDLDSLNKPIRQAARHSAYVKIDFTEISAAYKKTAIEMVARQMGTRLQQFDGEPSSDFASRRLLGEAKMELLRALFEDIETIAFSVAPGEEQTVFELRFRMKKGTETQKFIASARTGLPCFEIAEKDSAISGILNARLPLKFAKRLAPILSTISESERVKDAIERVVIHQNIHIEGHIARNGNASWTAYAPGNGLNATAISGADGRPAGTSVARWNRTVSFGVFEWDSFSVSCFPKYIAGDFGNHVSSSLNPLSNGKFSRPLAVVRLNLNQLTKEESGYWVSIVSRIEKAWHGWKTTGKKKDTVLINEKLLRKPVALDLTLEATRNECVLRMECSRTLLQYLAAVHFMTGETVFKSR